jgi:hypothetical protein
MKNATLHKKIYYVPGILTLVFAPILFINKTHKYIADRTEHCISIIVGVNEDKKHMDFLFPHRDYQTFHLSGLSNQDSSTLILIGYFAKGLNLSKNDSIGLKVVLDQKIKYKTFVDLLNVCLKSGISDWIPFGDTVFVFHKDNPMHYNNNLCQNHLTPDRISLNFICGLDLQDKKSKPTLIQKIKNNKEAIQLAYPFAIVYMALLFLSIRKIKNEV